MIFKGDEPIGEMKLYRIGELAKLSKMSARTIDYYTQLGLIRPEMRTEKNYRYYNNETLLQLQRIERMKKEKYTLDEIKQHFQDLERIGADEALNRKLAELQDHMRQLEKDVKELDPIIRNMKPRQMKTVSKLLTAQTAACIEALMLLMGNGPLL